MAQLGSMPYLEIVVPPHVELDQAGLPDLTTALARELGVAPEIMKANVVTIKADASLVGGDPRRAVLEGKLQVFEGRPAGVEDAAKQAILDFLSAAARRSEEQGAAGQVPDTVVVEVSIAHVLREGHAKKELRIDELPASSK